MTTPEKEQTYNSTVEQPTSPYLSAAPYPEEFEDIAPFTDANFKEQLSYLVKDKGFEHAIRFIMPDVDYDAFCAHLLDSEVIDDFQRKKVGQFLEFLSSKTSSGITADGFENLDANKSYTFLSNHRDIVLDASFMNLCFIRRNLPITQIAIGNNLLIYDWIRNLVRINRSFIVKRDNKPLQALEAAKQLSRYIHYVINQRHESIWIAQREGRAKDSNDVTQESLLKMLSIGGEGSTVESLMDINLLPVSISYEFDPNDYLKVKEFLLKRRDPEFKKSQHDDLYSMEVGLLKPKGRIHFQFNKPLNETLESAGEMNRMETIRYAREVIDREIHAGYKIYPVNYVAFDELHKTDRFRDRYTDEDLERSNEYFTKQLAKVDVPDITDEERNFMKELILGMYANPLQNKLVAITDVEKQ